MTKIGFFYRGGTGTYRAFGRGGNHAPVSCHRRADSLFLRLQAKEFGKEDIETETFRVLRSRMLATVRDSLNEGVGIAAPQVGISRQLVAVQRLDKVGEPFEFYVNPEIVYFSQDSVLGEEGCLSIPDRTGAVYRSKEIIVRYRDELLSSGDKIR